MKHIDHIGIAVKSLQNTIPFYTQILPLTLISIETVASEKTKVAFLEADNIKIELLEATGCDSPIAKFIEKYGEGIHHIAFQVDSVEKSMKELTENQVKLVNESPKLGANDSLIAFIHPKSAHGVLVELYEKKIAGGDLS
ncbi:methylmalonyl-CoA epimerase [Lederbergia graminis]|uniref:Methylmalonyl-CoA epimerase n=1 Tax=Lederbergia graminis TaxID=735518 RepID=A0ABW0LBZ0_9BACI|nr:methylmalonyl-CoA epimerase [Paenibacillus bovis]